MFNKKSNMLRLSALSLAVASAMAVAPTAANAEVSAAVGVSNMYLWRGIDLGNGAAQVSGDLSYSNSGFYTGVWAASGDTSWGQEYDLYAGYGAEFGGVSMDLSVWTYTYANLDTFNDPGELSDAVFSIGFAGLSAGVYDNIAGGSGGVYYTLGYGYDAFSIMAGKHDGTGPESGNMIHVDLAYAYNDNLSFIVSQQVDNILDNGKPKVVVSYSLPIGM